MSPMRVIGHPEWHAEEAVPPEPPVTVSNQVTVSRFRVPGLKQKCSHLNSQLFSSEFAFHFLYT
jgi:hypothetical protein